MLFISVCTYGSILIRTGAILPGFNAVAAEEVKIS